MGKRDNVLITGGAGFIGSNLADALMRDGERVIIADNFSRDGVRSNVAWLQSRHPDLLRVEQLDVADADGVRALVRQSRQVFHLAAQVAVTTSLVDPALDLRTNVIGTFNVLEAVRTMPDPPAVLFTSTNKVYGGMDEVPVARSRGAYRYGDGRSGISEAQPLDFHSPYGCSKGAADQYVHDYARIFGLPTVVFRMSCIYGTRQFGTEDQGWVAHFARAIRRRQPLTIFGDGYQVRDILWVEDLVRAMRLAMGRMDSIAGEVFNIGGGAGNAVSVRTVIQRLQEIIGVETPSVFADWRPGDQKIYVSDTSRAEALLGWRPEVGWQSGLERLAAWLEEGALDVEAPLEPEMATLQVVR
jgi:CDP-paratose 2-epimerase